jgi:hypothetical protein
MTQAFSNEELKFLYVMAYLRLEELHKKHSNRIKSEEHEFKLLMSTLKTLEEHMDADYFINAIDAVRLLVAKTKAKPLKLFNGRWGRGGADHIYVAAHSQADAIRVVNELYGEGRLSTSEIKNYWSKGAWGTNMEGITPERGAWVVKRDMNPDRKPPVRITPENVKEFK